MQLPGNQAASGQPYINAEEGLARVRGNQKLFARTLTLFLNSAEFDALEQKLAEGDTAAAGDVAHAIKGMTGNLSLTALFEDTTTLMNQLRAGAPPDDATLARYRETLAATRRVVEAAVAELTQE